ncbi:twin-arginine translocation signal domain-containing protein [Azospirillum sp.]|uniref:ABC transporter substrate-binding protein n=1 Tax=Azospirillum sp. TaxID=34012 RepID=UPI002D5B3B1C|nr:twin-arginine translocation signal domain-containing protein [Azospirillum sp.]HYD69013.1 twin-arginine translocation signal domain-containing protein [Azospirillum sp.]
MKYKGGLEMVDLASRRQFLKGGTAVAAGAAAGVLSPFGSFAAAPAPVRWASLMPGFTVLVTEFIRHHKLDEKNGFRLGAPTEYTTVPTYYGDFVAGNYDVCIGSWDSFATRYLGQVPIKLLCTITTAEMICILAARDTGKALDGLKGKVLAAPQSTGTYRIAQAVLREHVGLDIETWMRVQNVTNPAASVTLLRTRSADAALSWEPNVASGMAADKDLRVIFNAGQTYREKTGADLPYFGVAVRSELLAKDPAIAARLNGVFKQCVDGIMGNVPDAVKIVGDRTGFAPAVLQEAITSGRLRFVFNTMTDPAARAGVTAAAQFFARNELLSGVPDGGFFIQS